MRFFVTTLALPEVRGKKSLAAPTEGDKVVAVSGEKAMIPLIRALLCALVCVTLPVLAIERTPAPEGAELYFISPANGAVVSSPVTVKFGLRGMGVAPAGVDMPGTGHHHLLINLDALPPLDQPLPATDQVKHFGKGQTETTLELPAGTHSLQLLMGNHFHVPHDPVVVSDRITITVR
jgi:hypothetical protein